MDFVSMAQKSVDEAIDMLRNKPIKSTMLERLYLIEKANDLVQYLPKQLQLGRGLYYILDNATIALESHDLLAGRAPEKLPSDDQEQYIKSFLSKFGWRPSWLVDDGHTTLAWEMILTKGIKGLEDKAVIEGNEGKVWIYKAFRRYIERYGEAARQLGSHHIAAVCENIAYNPPKTFYEALQLILLIGHAYSVYACINSTLSYGRLDYLLRKYYERDLASGEINEELAKCLIIDFNCKNNLILGRGEHQMGLDADTETGWFRNPTYDTPQYVIIGGYTNEKDDSYIKNSLTKLFVESINPRFENPVYVFRYTKSTDDEVWLALCNKLRSNSSILVYNDETMVNSMINAGIKPKDAVNYTIHGCNWPDIPGIYKLLQYNVVNLVSLIMEAIDCGSTLSSIDDIYEAIKIKYQKELKHKINISIERKNESLINETLSCANCFYEDKTEYFVMYNQIKFVATAADIISSIDRLVFTDKKLSLKQLMTAVNNNFTGFDEIRALCKKADKFGNDNDFADKHAERLMNMITGIAEIESKDSGISVFNITTTDMEHISDGAQTKATPDGRLNGEPFSENLSPTVGFSGDITALLNSVAKLPFYHIHAGAFNLRIRRDWVKGNKGLDLLKIVLKTFFEMGGMQVQISVTDTEELIDAQKNPDKYKDLMVRITGYSAVFVDMCKHAQDEIIRRESIGAS